MRVVDHRIGGLRHFQKLCPVSMKSGCAGAREQGAPAARPRKPGFFLCHIGLLAVTSHGYDVNTHACPKEADFCLERSAITSCALLQCHSCQVPLCGFFGGRPRSRSDDSWPSRDAVRFCHGADP